MLKGFKKEYLAVLLPILAVLLVLPLIVLSVQQRTSYTSQATRGEGCTQASPYVGTIISETVYVVIASGPPALSRVRPTGPRPTPVLTPRTYYFLKQGKWLFILGKDREAQAVDFSAYADSGQTVSVVGCMGYGVPGIPGLSGETYSKIRGSISVVSISLAP